MTERNTFTISLKIITSQLSSRMRLSLFIITCLTTRYSLPTSLLLWAVYRKGWLELVTRERVLGIITALIIGRGLGNSRLLNQVYLKTALLKSSNLNLIKAHLLNLAIFRIDFFLFHSRLSAQNLIAW